MEVGALNSQPDSIQPLLQGCAQNDQKALESLYKLTAPKLFPLLVRILRREDWAQEVLQEAFMKIWNHAGHYNPGKAKPMTWMTSIGRNCALDRLRRVKFESVADSDDLAEQLVDDSPTVDMQMVQSEQAKALRQCMEQLAENQRNSLQLAYFEGLTHAELAERLEVPLGSVKTWIRRGMLSIKKCLEN